MGPLAKVIRLKLFLDTVPSSFANITRALRGCFRRGSVYVSFRFVLKQSKTFNSGDVFFDILITSSGASTPALVCCNTFRNWNESLNKNRIYPAQTITIEWTAEKCLDKWQMTNKPPQTDGRKCRQTLGAQIAKSSFSSNGNTAKDHVDLKKT